MESTSRRTFFKHAGQLGLVGGASALLTHGACAPLNGQPLPTGDLEMPEWPWTYTKLDPEAVRKRAYESYFTAHCAYAGFDGIVSELADVVGHPFDKIPTKMFFYGAGGVASFASICGACNGACAAISLVSDGATTMKLAGQLLSWYSATALPSDISNSYAVNGEFPVEGKTNIELPSSVSGSELCHTSVTNWCVSSGYASGSDERAERCARVAADTAARAVELLNAEADGVYDALTLSPTPSDATGCTGCHTMGTDFAAGNFTRGKADCTICHDSPHGAAE